MKWLGKALARTFLAAAAAAGVVYALALAALHDLQPLPRQRPVFVADAFAMPDGATRAVAMTGAGTIVLHDGGKEAMALAGHGPPVRRAMLVASGGEAVSADASGVVRLTRVEELGAVGRFDASRLGAVLRERLWTPYGKPVAEMALLAAAQVLPLHIPEAVRGRRGREFRDCRDGFCGPRMVELMPGNFLMGSPWQESGRNENEGPRWLATIAQPFAIGRFAVTFDEWDFCVADGGCNYRPGDEGWGRGSRPVINVSWDDITGEYLPWLNGKLGLKGTDSYRLPSEVEWEYAARAGSTGPFNFGDDIDALHANYNGKFKLDGPAASGIQLGKTVPVDAYAPNAFGLYQVHGNVWQWVQDCYHKSYANMPEAVRTTGAAWDGDCVKGDAGATTHVERGGSWLNVPEYLRSAHRDPNSSKLRGNVRGFRLARGIAAR